MAPHAAAHPRERVARREFELPHGAMARLTLHSARDMDGMIELQVRFRIHQANDPIAIGGAVTEVAKPALREELARIGAHRRKVLVIAPVAAVATRGRR
jgi:hypothetical protein